MKIIQKNKVKYLSIIAAISAILCFGYYCSKPKIAVIDFMMVQQKAKVYQSVIAIQREYEKQINEKIIEDSKDIEKDAKILEANKSKMTGEEIQKKMISLQRRVAKVQEKYRPVFERVYASSQIALKGAEQQIAKAIEMTSKETGVKILLPMNNVLYSDKSYDYTDKFVKNLDELIQEVPYPDPQKIGQQ